MCKHHNLLLQTPFLKTKMLALLRVNKGWEWRHGRLYIENSTQKFCLSTTQKLFQKPNDCKKIPLQPWHILSFSKLNHFLYAKTFSIFWNFPPKFSIFYLPWQPYRPWSFQGGRWYFYLKVKLYWSESETLLATSLQNGLQPNLQAKYCFRSNVNTQLGNLGIHSKRRRFRSNVIAA